MAYVNVDIDPWEVLPDISDEDLLLELQDRGLQPRMFIIHKIYEKYRRGENIDDELRELFFQYLGRIA